MDNKKIEIRNTLGFVMFEYECEDNTMKKTVENAVKHHVDLSNANLCGADLTNANLTNIKACNATFRDAVLKNAVLDNGILVNTDFVRTDLINTSFRMANVSLGNFISASMQNTVFSYADIYNARFESNITGAVFSNCKGYKHMFEYREGIPMNCPSDGAFIGWKIIMDDYSNIYLVKLQIPEDARRSSSFGRKCRCDKAKVLEIKNMRTGELVSSVVNDSYYKPTRYTCNEMVYPDSFDENRWIECSNGIHFFINKDEALNYGWFF